MKSLTIAFVTSRNQPMARWFVDSLNQQCRQHSEIRSVRSGPNAVTRIRCFGLDNVEYLAIDFQSTSGIRRYDPKPTVWQGPHRLTRDDWWAMANARNTALALCQTEWIAFLDDRCVLCPGWLDAISRAINDNYAVCGAYEKRHNMKVENGVIVEPGTVSGQDHRLLHIRERGLNVPYACGGEWWFGCSTALPLEWALQINGYDESCDSLGMEDVIFGLQLQNAGYPIRYDPAMMIIEDRTPDHSGPIMKRTDKGTSPNDKSHALLAKLRHLKRSTNLFDLRELRDLACRGEPFPIPTGPTIDWYDGQPLAEM